jgi:hypothetical protein
VTASEGEFGQTNARHSGSADGISGAAYEVVERLPHAIDSAAHFAQLKLSAPQQRGLCRRRLALRYERGIALTRVIRARRIEDNDGSLWSSFNMPRSTWSSVVLRGRNPETGRRVRARAVNGISENPHQQGALDADPGDGEAGRMIERGSNPRASEAEGQWNS